MSNTGGVQPAYRAPLPGSRAGEVKRLAPVFLRAADALRLYLPGLRVLVPHVTKHTAELVEEAGKEHCPDLPLVLAPGATKDALAACDVALVASGTATIETLLSERPMVVGYRINPVTFYIAQGLRLVRIKHVGMANLISGDVLASEVVQSDCVPERLTSALLRFFDDASLRRAIGDRYAAIHRSLKTYSDAEAAAGAIELMQARGLV